MSSRVVFALLALCGALGSEETMPRPRYAADGQMLRPEGYRDWMFVGANLGMGYREGAAPKSPRFHNIFMQREAYRTFAETGVFPDRTMLVMEVVTAGTNASINRQGQFQDKLLGIETAVKDGGRWSYYNFIGSDGAPLAKAKAFPKEACWNCHNEHGQTDNVFTQFYPLLRKN